MKHDVLQQAAEYTQRRHQKKRWQKVVTGLAAVVVFCTTYALILPAITMEKQCELPEHIHTQACYAQVTSVEKKIPVCTAEDLNIHQHSADCYNSDDEIVCGYADFVIHQHDSSCYDENGNLWCPLPIIEPHTHGESCWTVPETEPVHEHTDECYEWDQGETLICGQEEREGHIHSEEAGCYSVESTLTCQTPEGNGHQHEESCFDENSDLICGKNQGDGGHTHGENCYQVTKTLICEIPADPGHRHSSDCYEKIRGELVCTEPTDLPEPEETEPAESELTCEEPEIVPHEHTSDCFDADGNLICGKLQILEHQHTADCFEIYEESVDTESLTCQIPVGEGAHTHSVEAGCYDENGELTCQIEESTGHQHSALCYGTWELTCGMEEHVHSETCMPAGTEDEIPTEDIASDTEIQTEGTISGMEIPSGLPVQGTVYVSPGVMMFSSLRPMAASTSLDETESTQPLDVTAYVTNAVLSYRTDSDSEWIAVGDTPIPGDADLRLDIDYAGVNIDNLLAADCKMTFTLPDLMRNPVVNGVITSGTTEVGTITADGNVVTLQFDQKWLTDQKTETNTTINGDFYIESAVNISQVPDDGQAQLVIGNVVIRVMFEEDIIARSGEIDITKSTPVFSEEDDGDYLTYTITVTAGQDGALDVKVVDTFTKNKTYIDSYLLPSGAVTEITTEQTAIGDVTVPEGSMIWTVGGMDANETRTLTYKVKLKEGYTGAGAKGVIQNAATPFSEIYPRDPATSDFTPRAGASMSKTSATFVPDENGGGTITYTVWVKANENNTYTLDNVVIRDALDGSIQGQYATDGKYRDFLSYVTEPSSFHLYIGGKDKQNGADGLEEIQDAPGPEIAESGLSFAYSLGSLKPGEARTLTYTVKVEPGVFPAAGNADIPINNRAVVAVGGTTLTDGSIFNGYNHTRTIAKKKWDRKLAGDKLEDDVSVPMTGEVYDATGESVSSTENPGSFYVPAGSYQYQIVANEAGDWDISSASMTDKLSGSYMQFVGYVRVNAYQIEDNAPAANLTDTQVIANLSAREPTKTVWVKVDGQTTFTFTPDEIGLDGQYAYLLTYYAQPVNVEQVTQVVVSNSFELSGVVGPAGDPYTLAGVKVNASVVVEGTNSFSAEKLGWYYASSQDGTEDFANGALYWVIKVDGNLIPAGTRLRDLTSGTTHYIRQGSLVGVYTGSLGEKTVTDYDDLPELESSGKLTGLTADAYTTELTGTSLTIQLLQDVKLEAGQSLYAIVKTEPSVVPTGIRETKTFNNALKSSFDGTNWIDHNMVSQVLCGSNGLFKEFNQTITYDGSTVTVVKSGRNQVIAKEALGQPGTFVIWQIQANYVGNLSGRYRFEETIPDGMELAYLKYHWAGGSYNHTKPTTVQLTEAEFAALGDGWTEHSQKINGYTVYYYTNGQTVIWDVDGLVDGYVTDGYGVEYQIACRVTDPDVLLGGEAKKFNNHVKLLSSAGKEISVSSNSVSVQKNTIKKTGNYDSDTNGGRFPFTIAVNSLGEDLVKGKDTLTLVDELSDTLTLDTSTIQVTNTKTGEEITNYTLAVNGQTFTLTLPDSLPLTITYETMVNAPPEQSVEIINKAHWEGYTVPEGAVVEKKDFSYKVGGTVGVITPPSIKITKLDSNNAALFLAGATFTLQEGTYNDGTFTPGGNSWTGTTDENGLLVFGTDGQLMKYNTVYCLTETKAPGGYVLDAVPHYFAVAQEVEAEDGTKSYPSFPTGVTVWYQSAQYTYQAFNHKGEITVAKDFRDAGGNVCAPVSGTYTFGLYEDADAEGEPLQTVTITYNASDKESNKTAVFRDLDLEKTYYVFELDDQGNPIRNNAAALVHKTQFLVTYQGSSNGASNGGIVQVTNQSFAPELPETGGAGTALYTAGGTLLMAAAGILLYIQNKRRKEETASS